MLASIGGLPPLFKSTDTPSDIPSRRVEINAYGRKAVESADSATCELIFSLSPYTFLLFGVTWVFCFLISGRDQSRRETHPGFQARW